MFVPRKIREEKLRQILADDIGLGDVTVQALIPPNLNVNAVMIAKEDGVAAGIEEVTILAEYLGLKVKAKVADGDAVKNKQVLMEISGNAQTILSVRENHAESAFTDERNRHGNPNTYRENQEGRIQSQDCRDT